MRIRLLASAGLVGGVVAAAALLACADSGDTDAGDAGGLVVPPSADSASDQRAADASCGDGCAEASAAAWPFTAVTLPIDPSYNLFGAWGSAKDDVWLVGASGAAVHFDGATWSSAATPTDQALYAVWAGRRRTCGRSAAPESSFIARAPRGSSRRDRREQSVDGARCLRSRHERAFRGRLGLRR